MGVPFAANPLHGVLYPPMWLTALLPMPFAIDFINILHLMFGGIGTVFVAQRLGADRIGSAAAGIVFATSGYAGSTVSTGVIRLMSL